MRDMAKKRCQIDLSIKMPLEATLKALEAQAKNPRACQEEHARALRLFRELKKMMHKYC